MHRLLTGFVILACGLGAGVLAQALQRPGDTAVPIGLLMGVVHDALNDKPVANAEVTLGGAPLTTRNTKVLTDAEGRFVFMDLPEGTYSLTATKPGYAEGAHGRRRPLGLSQSVVLAKAERIGDLTIPLWKFAAISGTVTDEAGEPMVGIAVRVLARTVVAGKQKFVPGATARTDDRGLYRIASLTPGDYAVVIPSTQASAPEAIVDLFKQRGRGSASPADADLTRSLSFSTNNEPLYQIERNEGTRVGTLAFVSSGAGARAGVAPAPGEGRINVYPTRYYPAASTAAEASLIRVQSGEERLGADLSMTLVPTSRVSGVVIGPDGPMVAALSLVPDSDDLSTDVALETATTLSDAEGRFTFLGVPEGRHRLRAVWVQVPVSGSGSRGAPPPAARPGQGAPPPPPRPALGGYTLWATQPIDVGKTDLGDLAITLNHGFRIGGRSEFVGAAPAPSPDELRRMTATFDPADARPVVSATVVRGQFDNDGYLSSYQLPPGRYYVRINGVPAGWTLKAAMLNGRDMSNEPVMLDRDVSTLMVTFTDAPATLSGQVHDGSGVADTSATVLVFPADAAAWINYGAFPRRLREIRVGRDGHYRSAGLPPGDYLVVAIPDESTANWQDPAVLKALARSATSVVIAEGESRTLALRTSVVSR
jgi:Carboxypeptidase regulatory-like domain